jgi:LruC domain-containing protein
MNSLRLLIPLIVFVVIIGCSKTKDPTLPGAEGMANLVIPESFNWSASLNGTLIVGFDNPNNVSTELELLMIVDAQNVVVDRTTVINGKAEFSVLLPQNKDHFLYFHITEDKLKIAGVGNYTMTLGNTITKSISVNKSAEVVSCTSCDSPIINTGAEQPFIPSNYAIRNEVDVPGWKTTATDRKIELWVGGFNGVPAQEGRQFFELNANQVAALYQELCLEPGSTIYWSVWHRGRLGVDVAEVLIGPSVQEAVLQATMTDGNTAWGHYSGSYNVPLDQTTTFFVFNSVSSAGGNRSIGNFLDNFEISCDFDGDGVIDRWDDYPDDPTATTTSYFPESGKQVLAFEDLWPYLGDFDFNDLVLSNRAVIKKNSTGKPLEASFTISIDAIGASYDNGFAMMLYTTGKQAFTGNIIQSVSGDVSLDPDNVNGLIITNNVFETINDRYQNNGIGAMGVPDTLSFTITFNDNAADFIPEIYLFRTDDRGLEVHQSGYPRTATANPAYFSTGNDAGDYKTANGLPWAMEIIIDGTYKCPVEKVDILHAYPQFEGWATSNGVNNPTWYLYPNEDKVVTIEIE